MCLVGSVLTLALGVSVRHSVIYTVAPIPSTNPPQLPDINGQLASIESTISGIGGQITDGQNELLTVLGPQVMEQINSSLQRE